MPSSQVRSWVDCSLYLTGSFFLCSLRNRQLLMPVCRESISWDSAMHLAVLWTVASPHPEVSEKAFRQPSSLSLVPAYSVLSGFIQYLHTSRRFHPWIFCIFFHGELQDLQKLCSLLEALRKYRSGNNRCQPVCFRHRTIVNATVQ